MNNGMLIKPQVVIVCGMWTWIGTFSWHIPCIMPIAVYQVGPGLLKLCGRHLRIPRKFSQGPYSIIALVAAQTDCHKRLLLVGCLSLSGRQIQVIVVPRVLGATCVFQLGLRKLGGNELFFVLTASWRKPERLVVAVAVVRWNGLLLGERDTTANRT